jgi:predicted phosphodiesterase
MNTPAIAFGGPLSNLDALQALFAEARALGVPPDRMICTGDVVGYGAEPEACVKALRDKAIATVMGNVEEALGLGSEDCGCNFIEGSACDALSGRWYAFARDNISEDSRAWMRALPRFIDLDIAGHRVRALHGGAGQINRYVFASDTAAIADETVDLPAGTIVIAGHCGIPFTAQVAGVLWHNPGSLGLPANDGTTRVWYALIEADDGGLRISHRALAYDHGAAAKKMRAARLPEAYARALETGLWPDTAILPAAERAATGKALDPAGIVRGQAN